MEKATLKSKTIEELQSDLKGAKTMVGILTVFVLILLTSSLYGFLTKENKATFVPFMAFALCLGLFLGGQWSKVKTIQAELVIRKTDS